MIASSLLACVFFLSPEARAVKTNNPDLVLAARDGDNSETLLDSYLEEGASVDSTADDGETALMAAAEYGQVKTLDKLLKRKADVKARDKRGRTALLRAAAHAGPASPEVLKKLFARGASAEDADAEGKTALMVLPKSAPPAALEQLLAHGAKLDARDKAGRTPLAWVLEREPFDAVLFKYLVQRGAGLALADNAGRTPLMRAAAAGNVGAVESLLAKGVDRAGAPEAAKAAQAKLPAKDSARASYDLVLARLTPPAAAPAPDKPVAPKAAACEAARYPCPPGCYQGPSSCSGQVCTADIVCGAPGYNPYRGAAGQ